MLHKNLENIKLGIAGVGMVGGALLNYFKKQAIEPFIYDPGKGFKSLEELNKAGVIFVCVPTPYRTAGSGSGPTSFKKDGAGFDLSYVEKTCENLQGEKIVVIKSTVVPGTTEKLQKKYPQHKFLFNPEFLVESRANEDMEKPDRQIVGYTEKSRDIAQMIMDILPNAPFKKIMPATEAEMVKYFGNTFLSMKVIFGCEMYKLCEKLGINYDLVKEGVSADPRIGKSHLDVLHGGYYGYGGKCFPKDMRALIQFADKQGIDLKLHKTAEAINNALMEQQGIADPEIFSKRE